MVQKVLFQPILNMEISRSNLDMLNLELEKNLSKKDLINIINNVLGIIEKDEFKKILKSNYYLLNLLLSYELGYVKISAKYLSNFNVLNVDNLYSFYYFLTKILRLPAGNQKDKLNVLLEKLHPDKDLDYLLKCFNYSLKEFRQKYIINTKDYVISTKSFYDDFNEKDFFKNITWDFERDFKMMIEKGYINNKVYYEPELSNNYYLNYLTILFLRANIKTVLPELDNDILLEIVLGRSFVDLKINNNATILYHENNLINLPFGELNETMENIQKIRCYSREFNLNNINQNNFSRIYYMKNFKNQDIFFPPDLLFKMLTPEERISFNYFIVNEV